MSRRIAVVGGGIAGLMCARLLARAHDVTLFEGDERVGGHAHTVEVDAGTGDGRRMAVDTAVVVFNDRNYPLFRRLLDELDVATRVTTVGLSVRDDANAIEVATHDPRPLLAGGRNLLRPELRELAWDLARLPAIVRRHRDDPAITLGEVLDRARVGPALRDFVVLPLTATVWSIDYDEARRFPFAAWLTFVGHHGLARPHDPPVWRAFPRGTRAYVEPLAAALGDRVVRGAPIARVARVPGGVVVQPRGAEAIPFDEVVLAVHADQALAMLEGATAVEARALAAIGWTRNDTVLHRSTAPMPVDRRAWSAWNVRHHPGRRPTVTYHLDAVHGLVGVAPTFLGLQQDDDVPDRAVLGRFRRDHPRFDAAAFEGQRAIAALSGRDRVHFAGAWRGMGFHEDALRSAVEVARRLGVVW